MGSAASPGVPVVSNDDLVCYCFSHTRGAISADYAAHGASTIEADIRQAIDAGHCECGVLNPAGVCCLGDVRALLRSLPNPAARDI